jgi:hypothetical protein
MAAAEAFGRLGSGLDHPTLPIQRSLAHADRAA